jgi:hypothetical protein
MWISRLVLRDVVVAGVATGALCVYSEFRAPEVSSFSPHPAWAAVLLTAAVHGTPGLLAGLAVVGAGVVAANAAVGKPARLAARFASAPDLAAFGLALVVGWIGSLHLARSRRSESSAAAATARAVAWENRTRDLKRAGDVLRERVDRMSISLELLRDLARAIDGRDAPSAAHAAVELAVSRCFADCGAVQAWNDGRFVVVAQRGEWDPDLPDRTAERALREGRACAREPGSDSVHDSAAAAPIPDGRGRPMGVLAVRGVPTALLDEGVVDELSVLASWCSAPLAQLRRDLNAFHPRG